jgi:hypothetical protein
VERSSSHLKFHRAQEHLSVFDMAAQWWLQSQPHRVTEEVDAEAGVKQVVVIADEQPPMRLSLILGDAIQNWRAVLDHMVVELATEEYGETLPNEIEKNLAFPITTSKENFRDARKRGRLYCVPAQAQAFIYRLQPYRRGDDMTTDPLWILQELSNIDKHRRLPLLGAVVSEVTYDSIEVQSVGMLDVGGPGAFKDKAVLVKWSPPDAEVKVNLGPVKTQIAFGEGTPTAGQPVADVVREINRYIGAIGDKLRPGTSPPLTFRPTTETA